MKLKIEVDSDSAREAVEYWLRSFMDVSKDARRTVTYNGYGGQFTVTIETAEEPRKLEVVGTAT
jgi:hypothetical protein